MTEFKVGDIIENVRDIDDCGPSHIAIGDRFTVAEVSSTSVYFADKMNCPRYRPYRCYKLISRPSETPPTTITHEGYTYTRGERVRPDWLKDGAWVVHKETGELVQLEKISEDVFHGRTKAFFNKRLTVSDIIDQYRPHEPSDYKWGDWAMYDGKKVFVMNNHGSDAIEISSPPIYKKALDGWTIVTASDLTPTHAP